MLEIAQKYKNTTLGMQYLVMDKFFGGPRSAGNHLYRTSLLDKVIRKIPVEGITIRPETYALNSMQDDGFQWNKIHYVVGIHDDEQYNYDIYRKCFVHGVKHLDLEYMLMDIWKSYSKYDHDFKVALKAFSDSLQNSKPVYINRDYELYKNLFKKAGFNEKERIDIIKYSLSTIEDKIIKWKYPDAYLRTHPIPRGIYKSESIFRKLNRRIEKWYKKFELYF